MQNLAYQLDFTSPQDTFTAPAHEQASPGIYDARAEQNIFVGGGAELFSADAEAGSWQSWQILSDALGMSNVEIVCGEYLHQLFESKD